jgi:hypothetical protein
VRTACRTLILLIVLTVSAGLATPRQAMPQVPSSCVLVDQECLRCHPYLAQKCNYYECADGTEPVYCGAVQ